MKAASPESPDYQKELDAYLVASETQPVRSSAHPAAGQWAVLTSVAGSAMALAASSDAAIYHVVPVSPPTLSILPGLGSTGLPVDLDNDSINDLNLTGFHAHFTTWNPGTSTTSGGTTGGSTLYSGTHALGVANATGAKVHNSASLLRRFYFGDPIPSSGANSGSAARLAAGTNTSSSSVTSAAGNFLPLGGGTSTGYAGFLFSDGRRGWVRLRIELTGGTVDKISFLDWAWADIGESLTAGQVTSDSGAVPEPSTWLGGLAMGAAGVAAYRRRRQARIAADIQD